MRVNGPTARVATSRLELLAILFGVISQRKRRIGAVMRMLIPV